MKFIICINLILLTFACSQQSANTFEATSSPNLQNKSIDRAEKNINEKPLETLEKLSNKLAMVDVKTFDVQDLIRNSIRKDENGRNMLPFVDAEVSISLDQEPKLGEKVTVIPLNIDIEPFQLSILKFEKVISHDCENIKIKTDFVWNTELEKITNREILEAEPIKNNHQEFPFEVFIIYPAVKFAKNLSSEDLKSEILPKGVTAFTVKSAIDLTNDHNPDLLYVEFCCKDKTESLNNCDHNCIQWYKKINGVWKLIDDAIPC